MKKKTKQKEKGFTLIELLAVIVVLAILALIAVPIVLNIIKDARNNSNKRSIESYARAIDYAVSEYMSENPDQEVVTWEDVKDRVEYKGKVECQWGEKLSTISQAGEITLHGCKVNNKTNSIYGYEKGKVTEEKEIVYKEYNVGDEITYKGMKFYVIAPSDTKQDYVTLLKETPLTVDEVNRYGVGHVNMYTTYNTSASYYQKAYDANGYGGMAYYTSTTCGYPTAGSSSGYTTTGCTTDYDKSEIKHVVDGWELDKFKSNELKEVDGYKARLITYEELTTKLGYPKYSSGFSYPSNGETPSFVYNSNYKYWTMSPWNDSNRYMWYVNDDSSLTMDGTGVEDSYIRTRVIRPVINLLKSRI